MIVRLAWRNIWRQKRRSIVALIALVVGGAVAMFTDAWSLGMVRQLVTTQIMLGEGLMSIRSQHWIQGEEIASNLFRRDTVFEDKMRQLSVYAAPSISLEAMVSSSYNSTGLVLKGIEWQSQRMVNSAIEQAQLVMPEFKSGTVLLSQATADLLQVSKGDRVVLMTNAADSSLVSMSARVVGVFSTHSSNYDKGTAFVPLEDVQSSLMAPRSVTEIILRPQNMLVTPELLEVLRLYASRTPHFQLFTFDELFPMLVYQRDSTREMMWVFYAIIGLAVFFGIANAMSMAVVERTKEIGMIKAIGMNPWPIWRMFVIESVMLGLIGTVGAIVLFLTVDVIVFPHGIDLSTFSDGLSAFGLASSIQLEIDGLTLINLLWLPLCAVAGTIVPAINIARMHPLEALKHE